MTDSRTREAAEEEFWNKHPIGALTIVREAWPQGFIAGAEFMRERILGMLKSDEAENAPKPFKWNFVIEKTYNTGPGWADWLEKKLKEEA